VVFGLILHEVPEGFAMANAYIASPALGLLEARHISLFLSGMIFSVIVYGLLARITIGQR